MKKLISRVKTWHDSFSAWFRTFNPHFCFSSGFTGRSIGAERVGQTPSPFESHRVLYEPGSSGSRIHRFGDFLTGILRRIHARTRLADASIALILTINMIMAYVTADREALFSIFSDPDKFYAAAPYTFLSLR